MRRTRSVSILLGLGVSLALTALAAAQAPGPAIGSQATYRWTSTVSQPVTVLVQERDASGQVKWSAVEERAALPPIFVTYAVVRGDGKTYTLQIVTHEQLDGAPLSITQVTVDRASGKAVRSIIRRPKGLIDTPESGLRPMREAGVPQGTREQVTVPAGAFAAVRGTVQGTQVWVSDQVPALGLVRAVGPSGTLELVRSAPGGARDLLASN
jgi:hypothetical protein